MPFDLPGVKPGSDIESLFKAVGFVVVQWGHAEQCLDLMVAAIFYGFDGNPLLKNRPKMLAQKLEFLGKSFTQFSGLEQFRSDGESLLARFSTIGNKRHELVHGAITNLEIENGEFLFAKLDINKDGHHLRDVALGQSDFSSLVQELLRLGSDTNKLARQVWDAVKECP